MLSRIERGERLPSPESVEALAKHFGLSADYLMSETIAHRLVNRYGEEKSSKAAEHIAREVPDLGLIAGPLDEEDESALRARPDASDASGLVAGLASREVSDTAVRSPRRYGAFHERDILSALGAIAEPRDDKRPPREAPPQPPRPALKSEPSQRPAADAGPPSRSAQPRDHVRAMSLGLMAEHVGAEHHPLDPATEQVLRAAGQASEAAAMLVRKETPGLSLEARLEVVARMAPLAALAVDILRAFERDPDPRVRSAAGEVLRGLTRER